VDGKLREAAKLINLLTGLYDESGRISATFSAIRDNNNGRNPEQPGE
jgi:hypothetical protein